MFLELTTTDISFIVEKWLSLKKFDNNITAYINNIQASGRMPKLATF